MHKLTFLLTYFHLHIYKVSILHTDFRYHHNYVFILFIIIIINMKIRYKLTIIYLALKQIITHTVMILLILWILNPHIAGFRGAAP